MKFSAMYPTDRFYAADFKGKAWTLTFRAKDPVTEELLGKGSSSEKTLPIWHFEETPKKFPAVKTNGVCARALFGDESDGWGGHKITLYAALDASGLSDDGLCVRVKGSPEIGHKLVFSAQIGRTKKTFTLVPTGTTKPPASVDPATGEVTDAAEAAPATQTARSGDPGAEAAADAFTGPDAANGDSDEEPPGRGALFDTDDPNRPATTG
ncbi:MAG TPA: hypothetical protein VIK32_03615, partial [Candidatus Limnocylindrales bacterium]